MTTVTYQVPNISCMHCVHTIKTEIEELPGVKSVEANQTTKLVKIEFDPPTTDEKIKETLAEINYPVA